MIRFNGFAPCRKCGRVTHWAYFSHKAKKFVRNCRRPACLLDEGIHEVLKERKHG